jgi:carbon starvation protein CstA
MLRTFLAIQVIALAALCIFSSILAAASVANSLLNPNAILNPGFAAWVTFGYSFLVGVVPVVLFGAPMYWVLSIKKLDRWYAVGGVGIFPSLAFLLVDKNLAFWALIAGGSVALATHLAFNRWKSRFNLLPE